MNMYNCMKPAVGNLKACCGPYVHEPNFDGNPGAVMSVCKLVDGK